MVTQIIYAIKNIDTINHIVQSAAESTITCLWAPPFWSQTCNFGTKGYLRILRYSWSKQPRVFVLLCQRHQTHKTSHSALVKFRLWFEQL